MRLLLRACAVALLAAVGVGCGSQATAGSVPESAALAPANAVAFVTLVSDDASRQWRNADSLLGLFPDARDSLLNEAEAGLAEEGLTWDEDVAPAVGREVVAVVTRARKLVLLVRPADERKLIALMELDGEPFASDQVSGWTVLAEKQSHIDAYRTALSSGTLETNESFERAMKALPDDSLGRAWLDISAFSADIDEFLEELGSTQEFGTTLDSIAAALSAEDDGLLVVASAYADDRLGSGKYEPKLLERVPADAITAFSFGGTQEVIDRIEESADLEEISAQVEDLTGVSLDRLLDTVSGEGVLYIREGDSLPEITLALAPPDAEGAYETVDRLIRRAAEDAGVPVESASENGVAVSRVEIEGMPAEYALLDGETVIVTTSDQAIGAFTGSGPKLADAASFQQAAERVALGDRTSGFVYVDIDGLVPFAEDLSGEQLPLDVRRGFQRVDSFILQTIADDRTTTLGGFVRVNPR